MPDHDTKPLFGKTALVTGAARRLGRASAIALAEAGADVAITFRNSAREAQETVVDLSALGVRAFALRCDVTDESSVRTMMQDAGRELGRIDILVNNAGNYETAEFEKLTVRPMGRDFCVERARSISGVPGGVEVDAAQTQKGGSD